MVKGKKYGIVRDPLEEYASGELADMNMIAHNDLRREAKQALDEGYSIQLATLLHQDEAEAGEALYIEDIRRIGIAWGADASWADVESLEHGVHLYFEDPEEFRRRN